MKLQFEKTQVLITDKQTEDKWIVEFTGKRTELNGKVYKNGKYITTYFPKAGHANKTMALHIVKTIIGNNPPQQP